MYLIQIKKYQSESIQNAIVLPNVLLSSMETFPMPKYQAYVEITVKHSNSFTVTTTEENITFPRQIHLPTWQ